MAEIGSEFCKVNIKNCRLLLSGRTALDMAIRDILAEREITVAHLPSFCCESMIEPFIRNEIPVCFYEIYFDNGLKTSIPQLKKDSIFLYIEFFGYKPVQNDVLEKVKESGCVTICDSTHSWLSKTEENCDYNFASCRKWSGFSGIAFLEKRNGRFNVAPANRINERYEQLRTLAQSEKSEYLKTEFGEKSFLKKFIEAEEMLENNYVDCLPTYESIEKLFAFDNENVREIRRENAQVLLEGIAGVEKITPIFTSLAEEDAPLCVPIIAPCRDSLRNALIDAKIYSPVHWPVSELHRGITDRTKNLYASELSLVCDQRYDKADMRRIVDCVKKFYEV